MRRRDTKQMGFTCLHLQSARVDLAIHLSLPVFVYESVEGHAVFPAGGEVCDVDIGIPAKKKKKQPGDVTDRTSGT